MFYTTSEQKKKNDDDGYSVTSKASERRFVNGDKIYLRRDPIRTKTTES